MRQRVASVLEMAGGGLVVAGLWSLAAWLGMVAAGLLLATVAVAIERGEA